MSAIDGQPAQPPHAVPVLDYGRPTFRFHWLRKRLPRPSNRTLILFFLTALAVWWFWHVKDPWLLERTLPGTIPRLQNCLSQDGNFLLTDHRGQRRLPEILNTRDGTVRAQLSAQAVLIGVDAVEFSPDATRVLTHTPYGPVSLWDATTGRLIASWSGTGGPVFARFTPTGNRLVVPRNSEAHLADSTNGRLLADLVAESEKQLVGPIVFDHDVIAIMLRTSNLVKLFDAESGAQRALVRWRGPPQDSIGGPAPERLALRCDVSLIATIDSQAFRMFDSRSGDVLWATPVGDPAPQELLFAPDGKTLMLFNNKTIEARDARSGTLLAATPAPWWRSGEVRFRFTNDGNYLSTGGVARLFTWPALHRVAVSPGLLGYDGPAFSPDSRELLFQDGDDVMMRANALQVCDVPSGKTLAVIRQPTVALRTGRFDFRFLPDGNHIATQTDQGSVLIWKRNRPYGLLGYFALPQLYLAVVLIALFVTSAKMDRRRNRGLIKP